MKYPTKCVSSFSYTLLAKVSKSGKSVDGIFPPRVFGETIDYQSRCWSSCKWVGGWACGWARQAVQRGGPAGAALTRTSLSIAADLGGRSAGLRRDSPRCRLTRPVTRGLIPGLAGWVWGCCDGGRRVGAFTNAWVGGGVADMPRGQLQQGQRLHGDKSPQHTNEESRLAC